MFETLTSLGKAINPWASIALAAYSIYSMATAEDIDFKGSDELEEEALQRRADRQSRRAAGITHEEIEPISATRKDRQNV